MDRPVESPLSPPWRQALILAAGRGSRMGRLTERQPKCLHPLAGKPLLAWTLDALRANGLSEVLVVGGWQHEALVPWCEHLRVNAQWSSANMVRSLLTARDWLARAPTLVVYGDGAYGPGAIAAALAAPQAQDIVVPVDRCWLDLWRRRFDDPLSDAETLRCEGDRLRDIGRRPESLAEIDGQFMGLLRLSVAGWRQVAAWLDRLAEARGGTAIDRLDTTALLQGLLAAGLPLHGADVHGGWVEIDSPQDAAVVEQALDQPGFRHDFRR